MDVRTYVCIHMKNLCVCKYVCIYMSGVGCICKYENMCICIYSSVYLNTYSSCRPQLLATVQFFAPIYPTWGLVTKADRYPTSGLVIFLHCGYFRTPSIQHGGWLCWLMVSGTVS